MSLSEQTPATQVSMNNQTLRSKIIWFPEWAHHNIKNVQFSTKNYEACNEKECMAHSKEKNNKTVPGETLTLGLLDKDSKSTILKCSKSQR